MKLLPIYLQLLLFSTGLFAQVHWDTVYVQPLEICLGQCVDLYSNGGRDQTLMNNDFNDQSIGDGWATNVTPTFSNPCGNTLDGTPCCWFGSNSYPRSLETIDFDVTDACEICFDLKFSEAEGGDDCESPDEAGEGVALQWSNDGGANWNDIIYFCPDGNLYSSRSQAMSLGSDISNGDATTFTSWANYCFSVPAAAAGANTRFRWYQVATSGASYDNWGVDNVFIHCPQPPVSIIWNDSNNGDFYWDTDPPDQCPTQNTTYTITMTDGTYTIDTAFDVIVYQPPTMEIQGLASQYCVQNQAVTLAGMPNGGEFSGQGIINNNQFDPATAGVGGPYTITYTWYQLSTTGDTLCSYSTDTTVTVVDGATPTFTVDTEICEDETTILNYTGNANNTAQFNWSWDGLSVSPGTSRGPHTISNNAPGIYNIALEVEQNTCVYDTTVQLTIYEKPVANAGSDDEICGMDYTLDATPSIGNGEWSMVSGTGTATFTNINSANTSVTVSQAGSYVFKWKEISNICSDSDNVQITFYEIPVANAGNDTVICGPSTQLNATPSVGVGTWTVNSSSVDIDNIHYAKSNTTVHSYGTYNFTWKEVNHICVDSDNVQITYYEIPTSDFSVDLIHCFNDISNVTYIGNAPSSANYHWNWDGGNVVPGNGQGPHQISWNTAGTYNISLYVENNGCYSDTTINSLINPELLTSSITHTDLLCFGDSSGTVDVSYTGGTYPFEIEWNNSDYNGQLSLDSLNGGIYSVTITDGLGCKTTSSTTVNEPTKLVLAPIPDFNVCRSSMNTAIANVSGGTPAYTYFWDGISTNSNTLTFQALQNESHNLIVVDANDCKDSTSFNVTVTPHVNIDLFANQDTVCPGDEVMITSSITGGAGAPYTLTNYNTGELISTPFFFIPTETDNYITIQVEDICGDTDTSSIKLNLYPLPIIDFDSDIHDGCQPLAVWFNSDAGSNQQSYLWNFGDNSYINYSSAANPIHIFEQSGSFDVSLTVTSANGCKKTITKDNFITVYPKPKAKFYFEPNIITTVKPEVNFINTSENYVTSLWYFDDGDTSIANNPQHTYPNFMAKDYLVTLIAISNFGCRDTARSLLPVKPVPTIYAPTAISPDNDGLNDVFFVTGSNIDANKFKLIIYDRWGEEIWETDKFDIETGRSETWDGKAKNNKKVQIGVYKWIVIYYDLGGSMGEKSGNVTVIR